MCHWCSSVVVFNLKYSVQSPCQNLSLSYKNFMTLLWMAECFPTSRTEVSNGMMLIPGLLLRAFRTLKLGTNMPTHLARLLTRSACTRRGSSNAGVSIQEVCHHLTLALHLYGTPTGERVAFGMKDLVHLLSNLQTNSAATQQRTEWLTKQLINYTTGRWTNKLTN